MSGKVRPPSNRGPEDLALTRTVSLEVEELIIRLRKTLTTKGVDAGAETIAAHLQGVGIEPVPAVSTIWRILSRRGFVVPQPQKRPRSSWRRFCADQPNERWQADITHWRLADGSEVEILNILDDQADPQVFVYACEAILRTLTNRREREQLRPKLRPKVSRPRRRQQRAQHDVTVSAKPWDV